MYTFGAWIWTQVFYFFDGNQESYCHLNQSNRVTRNTDSNYVPLERRKNGRLMICSRIWLVNIFPISWDQSSWNQILGKKIFVPCSWQALIALKMCWKVTFSHRFNKNFWTLRNFQMRPEHFRKYTFSAWIWTQILYFFDGNQKSYCHLNISLQVSGNTNSNYVLMEGGKNGSLTIRSWIWLRNIFPI